MSSREIKIRLSYPESVCISALDHMVNQLNWKILERGDNWVKLKQPFLGAMSGNPVTLIVSLTVTEYEEVEIVFNASNYGFGKLNSNRVDNAIKKAQKELLVAATEMGEFVNEVSSALDEGWLCASCLTTLPSGTKFCSNCGSKITKKCPKCHHENTPGSKFCGNCGGGLLSRRS